MAEIKLESISKAWNESVALKPTDATIKDGEFLAILGPSGCGKSTLLFMLAGIYTPTSGDILFDNQRVNEVEAKDRNVGIVFQSYALYPHMSVEKNIMFPLKFQKVEKQQAQKLAKESAQLVHIDEFLQRKPNQLSGGQQQRVALARALVKKPQLLLLDEPLSNLDATLRSSMRSEIRALQKRLGVTTILVTHDQIEATTMADRIICMSRGQIEQIGSAAELYYQPNSLFVAQFIGSPAINILAAKAEGEQLNVGDMTYTISQPLNGQIHFGIRPENIHITEQATDILGEILSIEVQGREAVVQLATKLGELSVLYTGADIAYQVGQSVNLHLDKHKIILFDANEKRIESTAVLGLNV